MGTAHAGHDQCAHCFFQYIKPALQAERVEMKRRKAIKRNRLSPENRALIVANDLKEPLPAPPEPPVSVKEAVFATLFEREIERATANGQDVIEAAGGLLANELKRSIPLPLVPPSSLTEEMLPTITLEPAATAECEGAPPPVTYRRGRGNGKPAITDAQRHEIAEAFAAGESTTEICRAYDIGSATLYGIVKKAGLPLRGRPGSQPREELHMPKTSPVPPTAAPPVNGTAAAATSGELNKWTWTVTYTRTSTYTEVVAARSFNDAAAAITNEIGPAIESLGDTFEVISVTRAQG